MAKRTATPERDTEVFNEVDDTPRRVRGSRKLRLSVTDDKLDWTAIPDERRIDVLAALAADDDVRATLKAFDAPDANLLQLIEEKHINFFLDAVEAAECFFIPRMVARKMAKNGVLVPRPGGNKPFTIEPDVAKQAFKFRDRAKLLSTGVAAANANLPDKIKKLIARVGPGSEFVGRFFVSLREQQMLAIQMQVKKEQQMAGAHARGGAHASPAATAQPQPKPNGKSAEEPQGSRVVEVAAPAEAIQEQIP